MRLKGGMRPGSGLGAAPQRTAPRGVFGQAGRACAARAPRASWGRAGRLGPVAALAYRLLALATENSKNPLVAERAGQLRHAFDWLPVRLLAASFALVGNFVAVGGEIPEVQDPKAHPAQHLSPAQHALIQRAQEKLREQG